MDERQLASVDPLRMNLIVAKGIPALASLDIGCYQKQLDEWVDDFRSRCLPKWEPHFHKAPGEFEGDFRFFLLGMICQYLELEQRIEYKRDQRDVARILYTNPSDLFLSGVLESREGTCGNLAALHVAIGWRLGLPVSLAAVHSHFLLRFDDGDRAYNIEATQSGYGGFKSDPDEYLIRERKLSPRAILSGSDLRALSAREMLGAFIGLRARHIQDVGKCLNREDLILESEADWLLARRLYPTSRWTYRNQAVVTALRGMELFEPNEVGHPATYPQCLKEIAIRKGSWWNSNKPTKL